MAAPSLALASAAADLVTRARLGEQNAVAMIIEIRKAAERGVQRAKDAAKALHAYISSHPAKPVRQTVSIGAEDAHTLGVLSVAPHEVYPLVSSLREPLAIWAAVILLAGSGPITQDLVTTVHGECGEEASAFTSGVSFGPDPSRGQHPAYRVGRVIAWAFKLQQVRRQDSPIARYDEDVAWELGE